ncbi:MAG: transglycosylase SLT domain-containing protein [Mariprofundaceae bacterium]|nr:transglycosylase SLT domain-containing protein [Mariprofundaceae bacterium]
MFLTLLLLPQWAIALTAQQTSFQEAREALRNNDLTTFNRLYAGLESYPLRPYLDVWRYWNHLDDRRNDSRVERLLTVYAAIPEAIDLRIRWINALAKRGKWKLVAEQIALLPKAKHPNQSMMLLSLWHNGHKKKAVTAYRRYWRAVTTPDSRLLPIDKQWKKAGHPTADDVWARVNRQVKKGRWSAAKKIAQALPKHHQAWLSYWQQVQKAPARWLKNPPKRSMGAAQTAKILDDGLRRLGKKEVLLSWKLYQSLRPRLKAPHDGILMRHVALRAAYQHKPQAIAWLQQLAPAMRTDTTRTWPARLWLLQSKWSQALAVIDALPSRIRRKESSRWQYWRARCLAELGQKKQAITLYRSLAGERGYYSFLAAEHLQQRYQINAKTRTISSKTMARVKKLAGLQRAKAWYELGQSGKASREWSAGLRGQNKDAWYAAMLLAERWNWSEKALRAASRAGAHDHLDIRFPMPFYDDVTAASKRSHLSLSLLWSVMRQESLFNPSATSYVGAKGLMQLMPRTARAVAKHHPKVGKHPDLTNPSVNILLGSWYLGSAMERFDGRTPLAVAAYNAGPHRVSQWLKQTPFKQADVWVEAIPFNETRNYVQRIMAYSIIYDWRLGLPQVSLLERLKG